MSTLQKKFNGDVVHFYVTTQPRKEVEDFFARRPEFLKYDLRFITDAGNLAERFHHSSLPYFVWIGKDGKIKALTNRKQVTEANIRKLLETNTVSLPVKRSFRDLDPDEPYFSHEAFQNELIQGASLAGMIDGLPSTQGIRRFPNGFRSAFALNASVESMYAFAYAVDLRFQPVDVPRLFRFQLRDSTRFFDREDGTMIPKKYCFEQLMRFDSSKVSNRTILRKAQRELDHVFGLRSEIRTVKTNCYIISKGKEFKQSQASEKLLDVGEESVKLKAQRPQTVVAYVKYQFSSRTPILMERFEDSDKIDIELRNYSDVELLRKDLAKAGLDIRLEPREIQMVLVTD
ncbi:hypothetical protein GCM10023184_37220 [Flaviaesturariibacter amylovorans]|uniref:Uncharacterized protein n=2 Tax=Flaviaesturariibacter amylovorans TaxID=1084520 RepID=A0ABP8HIL5_9BACT